MYCLYDRNQDHPYVLTRNGKHSVQFEAAEKKHSYIIKTHGCLNNNQDGFCIAAYRKERV